jgi:exodeoxyribonuclease V beta subunit
MIRGALCFEYVLPAGRAVKIAALKKSCRMPEMEFQCGVGRDWIHGFMDLVFREENPVARHPWRYFVLDWKSDRLEAYDRDRIGACIRERHYDLQAKIYCHALDRFLQGLLGKEYDPEKNLGGAVYVFLRSFADTPRDGLSHTWYYPPKPEEDAVYVRSCLLET